MARIAFFFVLAWLGHGAVASAQHWHHGRHYPGGWSGFYSAPAYSYGTGGGAAPQIAVSRGRHPTTYRVHPTIYLNAPPIWSPSVVMPVSPVVSPVPWQPIRPSISIVPVASPTPIKLPDDLKSSVKPSSPASRLKSLEHQARGDEKLRKFQWAQAYMAYRSAIDSAGDRGEARFRQGFTYTAMQHYASAVREFQRGLALDAELPEKGIRLEMLFGPGSLAARASLLNKVADWVGEETSESDRWFLLGLLLHYEEDPRSREALAVARDLADGPAPHIQLLLDSPMPKGASRAAELVALPPIPDAAKPGAINPGNLETEPLHLPLLLDQPVPLPPQIQRKS